MFTLAQRFDYLPTGELHHDGFFAPVPANWLAVDAGTGETRWRSPVEDTPADALVLTDTAVYLGTHAGTVASFERGSGEERCRSETGTTGRPAVGEAAVYARDGDGLVALDRSTGGVCWRTSTDGQPVSVAVADGAVVSVLQVPGHSPTRGLAVREATDGTRRWRTDQGGDGSVTAVHGMAVAHGTVYASTDEGVVAFGLDDGAVTWSWKGSRDAPDGRGRRLVVVGDTVLTYGRGGVRTLDAATGDTRGAFAMPDGTLVGLAPTADGVVLVVHEYQGDRDAVISVR